jgi:hypothetical protein
MDSLPKTEAKLDHELHNGDAVNASMTLRHEMQTNPQEALTLIKSELVRNAYSNDKSHVTVAANGDVFVNDKDCGLYAGTLSQQQMSQLSEVQPPPPAVRPAAPPPLAPLPVREVKPLPQPVPLQSDAQGQPYEYQQPRQPGVHIPFPIDVGVEDGSLRLGVNILGLAKGGITLGEHNRGYVGSDLARTEVSAGVDLSPNHVGPAADWTVIGGVVTQGNARVGIDPTGSGIDLGAGVNATALAGTLGAGGHAGAELGRRVGPHANGYVYAGPAAVSADGYGNLDRGLRTGADADVSIQPVVGVHGKVRAGLGARNEAHADVGANLGDNGISTGAGLYPQLRPDLYSRAYSGPRHAGVGLNPPRAWSGRRERAVQANPPELGGLY